MAMKDLYNNDAAIVTISNNGAGSVSDAVTGNNLDNIDFLTMKAITLTGVVINSNASLALQSNVTIGNINGNGNLNINFIGNSLLTLSGTEYNGAISDTNSSGSIYISPNLNVLSNGQWGTTEQPIGNLTIGNNSTLTLTDHLYVNSLILDNGASIIPPEIVHIMGNNIDTNL